MTVELLEREHGNWHAHAHIDKFRAEDEREAMHVFFPREATFVESAAKHGLVIPEAFHVPQITGEMMLSLGADVVGTVDEAGNLLANAGINRLGSLLIGGGGQAYDATHTAIGVGDTNTAAAASQTDLSAAVNAANRYVQIVDSTPTFSVQVLTCVATFATGNGNFAWAEWAIGGNTASAAAAITAPMLNRKVAALGTKTSAAAWTFTVTITIS